MTYSITAPVHPHATGVAVYPALFFLIFVQNWHLWYLAALFQNLSKAFCFTKVIIVVKEMIRGVDDDASLLVFSPSSISD